MKFCMKGDTQTRLALHGAIIVLIGFLSGIGFSYAATVGDKSTALYDMWKFAHLEGIFNGMLVLAVAGVWAKLDETRAVRIGKYLLIIGAYCNAIGPIITALFIGHRVIQPETLLESFVVYGFYIPGCLPLPAFAIFVWAFYKKCR